ncbi:hypothetical protein GCM10025788_09920 [Serinicoccus chungangensis]
MEGSAVLVGVLHLQQLILSQAEMSSIVSQGAELLRQTFLIDCRKALRHGIHQHLQGRQSLLSVDDRERADSTHVAQLLLQHDGPKEVGGIADSVVESQLAETTNVRPQRGKLVFLCPDVGALKKRHRQVLREGEDLLGCLDEGVHDVLGIGGVFWSR